MNIKAPFDEAGVEYQQTRKAHWDSVAQKREHWRGMGRWYHRRIMEVYKFLVNPNQRVLEILLHLQFVEHLWGCPLELVEAVGLSPNRTQP